MAKYDFKKIEAKWQKRWLEDKAFRSKDDSEKPKFYQLETFPYPSAAGLHVGHPKGYIAEDVHARFMRMKGHEVLYTIGWDAFGLPTENYAIKVGKSPQEVAKENVKNFKRQVQMFGLSYDWDREINTSDPEYYKWTQWLFIQLYKKGLAYRAKAKVNWCPTDMTVLANEQVVQKDGKNVCERCKSEVEQRDMEQWFLKITDYAERLLNDLKGLDWPEATVKRQADWIGKSEGALLKFSLVKVPGQPDEKHSVEVFTTRPDTLFGATFLVVSPELAQKWIDVGWQTSEEVREYIRKSLGKKELDRLENQKDKTGVFTGVYAINPGNKEEIPVWVADYVLGSYGTGAIMAVPAHDERDFEFAKKFKLSIQKVIDPMISTGNSIIPDHISASYGGVQASLRVEAECWSGEGVLVNSGKFDGMDSEKAKWEITKEVGGEKKIQYKIRDWSVSRQRYWGVPIPMIHCAKCGIQPVDEKDLPVLLPDLEDYRPKGKPPLAGSEEFIKTKCPKCGGEAERDSETLDTFVDSSWYYLRYTDPENTSAIFDMRKADYWMPVDLYVIGAEHTVLHLLYSRFITKFLHDQGILGFVEPFKKLRHVGLILGSDGQKMSKSRGNVVNPDELIEEFGADSFRVYEMFMGPFEDGQPWDPQGILGAERFLARVRKLIEKRFREGELEKKFTTLTQKTIKKVGEDIDGLNFNTAISALMILLNDAEKQENLPKSFYENFVKLLHPFAPHMTQELWEGLGHKDYITFSEWPKFDEKLIKDESFNLVIQINGKVRDSVEVESEISQSEVEKLVLEREKVQAYLDGQKPKKVIYVPGRLVNLVV